MIAFIVFSGFKSFAITLFDLCMMEDFEFCPPVPKIMHNSFWLNSVSYESIASLDVKASSNGDYMVCLGNESPDWLPSVLDVC